MKSLLKLHTLTLLGLALAANVGLQLLLAVGQIKSWGEIDWMDVVGEGGCAALALAWLIMLLHSRPAGRVTRLLALGWPASAFPGGWTCSTSSSRSPPTSPGTTGWKPRPCRSA